MKKIIYFVLQKHFLYLQMKSQTQVLFMMSSENGSYICDVITISKYLHKDGNVHTEAINRLNF